MTPPRTSVDPFESGEWKRIIASGAGEMGIRFSGAPMEQLVRFAKLLNEWNGKINLTAITDPGEVAVKHFLDSMAGLPYIPEKGSLLDIGSGGGFPGLVIAVLRPALSVTSIDSVRKKVSFQQQLIRTLGLASARALHTRAEALSAKAERYDIVVSRALGALDMFVTLGLPVLAERGRLIAYKGALGGDSDDEIETLKSLHTDLSVSIHTYLLPSSGDRRSLVFIGRK